LFYLGARRSPLTSAWTARSLVGNRTVAGVFRGDGREWKVHEDSHYEPLLIAYEAAKAGDPWPFVEAPTKTGTALDLKPELRQHLSDRRHKYLYIYSV
jgi:hypothetical protein